MFLQRRLTSANKHIKSHSTSLIVVQSPNHIQVFVTPWTAAREASLFLTISWSLPKFMSMESVMPSQWGTTSHQSEVPSSKNLQISAGEDVEKREHFYTFGGNVNWHSHYEEHYRSSLKNINRTTISPRNPTPGHLPRDNNSLKNTCAPVFIVALSTITRAWMQLNCS